MLYFSSSIDIGVLNKLYIKQIYYNYHHIICLITKFSFFSEAKDLDIIMDARHFKSKFIHNLK